MRATRPNPVLILLAVLAPLHGAMAIEAGRARAFARPDLHLTGGKVTSFSADAGLQAFTFEGRFLMMLGPDRVTGDSAVVWLQRLQVQQASNQPAKTKAWIYTEGEVAIHKGPETAIGGVRWQIEQTDVIALIELEIGGEVFITADSRHEADFRKSMLYRRAFSAFAKKTAFASIPAAMAPATPEAEETEPLQAPPRPAPQGGIAAIRQIPGLGLLSRLLGRQEETRPAPTGAVETARYPVNIAPAGAAPLEFQSAVAHDGTDIATVVGRFYLWQKQNEVGGLLELQADSAVIFYADKAPQESGETHAQGEQPAGIIRAVYVSGDVIMTEGQRTIRADELFYDFERKRGIAVNAVMRTFDAQRGIPIYIRAAKLRRVAENQFEARDIVLTTSEFATPQISLGASSISVTDTTAVDEAAGKMADSSYDALMKDVRLKFRDQTILYWPSMRSDLERPDVPIKSVRVGNDGVRGTSVETQWYLSRLLGLAEPDGVDGTFALDYYSKRGLGSGAEIDYEGEDRFGRMIGYIIDDNGEDRLGRHRSRRGLEPPRELRGRFSWVHRELMPYNWQLTTGINYESDENFVESYYRSEFNLAEDRETYVHLKRSEDNWALAFLGKGRINDFADELEEMPGAEFHLTGQSLFDDRFTFYSDSQAGGYRQRIGNEHDTLMDENGYGFASHRSELDMPLNVCGFRAVPYVAGTAGYDDRSGFNRSLVDGSFSGTANEDVIGIAEGGIRLSTELWKLYPGAVSRLWDLNGLRHIVRPEAAAAVFTESDDTVNQHDTVYLGLSQRLQTKRGPLERQRPVEWMRLDAGFTFVNSSEDGSPGAPDRFLWNRPMTPLRIYSMPTILNGDLGPDLRQFELYGPRRNYFSADYAWHISDATAILSDMYYDLQGHSLEQFDVGVSRTRWPDLSYYIGCRYLRDISIFDEHGSNAFVFAATYVLDPRYTLVFAQQFDFDYGANVQSDITLIRRYHRLYWGLTYSSDGSLDDQAIVFSIWPQGVPEIAIGSRRYVDVAGPGGV